MKKSTQRRGRVLGRLFDSVKVGALVLCLPMVGCADVDVHAPDWTWDGDWWEARNTDHEAQASFTYTVTAAPTLSLTAIAGTVEIVGSSSTGSVTIEGVRSVRSDSDADAHEHLSDLEVDYWESDGTLFVETRQPGKKLGRAYEIEYRITVPEGTDLRVTQAAGPVEVRSVRGDVDIKAVAGRVTLDDLVGDVRTTVTAGEISASLLMLTDGVVELTNSAGDISLSIPTETSASLRAATVTGTVRLDGLDLDDEDPRSSVIRGTLSGGDGTIRLETVSGDITVKGR